MVREIKIIVILALFVLFGLAMTVKASDYDEYTYSKEALDYRNGADADDWIEMGSGLVSESPDNEKTIQLTGGGQDSIPGMAASVYCFEPPAWVRAFRIKIWYRDESGDDEIAGRVFIKTKDKDSRQTSDELFYGDTFILRANKNSEIIRVSAERYIENETIEIHVVASGQDQLTVESIEIEYLRETPEVKIVHEYHNDYWDHYPRYRYWYNYYYWSPHHYWPTGYHYVVWVIPVDYYWYTWRPWCRDYVIIWCGHYPRCWRRYADVYNDPPAHDRSAKIERIKRIHERLISKEYAVRNKTEADFEKKKYRSDQNKYQKETRKYSTDVTKKGQRDFTKMKSVKSKDIRVIDKERISTDKESRRSTDKRDLEMKSRSQVKERKEIREPRIVERKEGKSDRREIKYKEKTQISPEKYDKSSRNQERSAKYDKSPTPEKSSIRSQSPKETPKVKTERDRNSSKRK